MLEATLIGISLQRLAELRSYIAAPSGDDSTMRVDVTSTFCRLSQLIELAHVSGSGLSSSATETLLAIETEMTTLCRAFTWLHCR